MRNWIDTKNCQHYDLLLELKDAAIADYEYWQNHFETKQHAIKFSDRYGEGENLGWWACPIMDATRLQEPQATKWPRCTEVIKRIPGVLNVCVNFIEPKSIIPEHSDDYWDMSTEVIGEVRGYGTMIGISMPSADPKVVGFQVDGEIKGWDTGDLVSFDGYKKHSGWNHSDQWRVTMILDIREEYWNLQ